MRKQIDGLALLVQEAMALNPFDQALFLFGDRQRDKVKLLFWERNGFVVWYKRLERERFKWPTNLKDETMTLTGQELNWLLNGYNSKAMKPHEALYFQWVGYPYPSCFRDVFGTLSGMKNTASSSPTVTQLKRKLAAADAENL
ncbi:IS66 family insertion sequence element accessory protein TnpB [Vreelandella glaciei]|uniref:IS66 family insertion sequence element accessory protein TnpB n=1 Tax=Vreelandella glaciei TaxID=186761 RepID=UPI0030EDDD60|tara:strand:- start:936 stop:1364 length:429 start_codon:yes stop_codon:yes gene_type:complete